MIARSNCASTDGQVAGTMLIFAGGNWVERRHVTFFSLLFL